MIYICIFFLGAAIASFLNASFYRIEKKYKYPEIIKKGSHCENCNRSLTWWELFPIIGYILVRGKCRTCKEKINIYYPLSELFLGLTFILFYMNNISWYLWIIILFLFILSSHDVKYKAIPRNLVHILLGLCIIFFFVFSRNIENLFLPLCMSLLLIVANFIKRSFGIGDIILLFAVGILLSYEQYFVMFWLGIILALLYAIAWIVVKKVNIKKAKVPMIPFFSISFAAAVVYGTQLYELLLKYLEM